METKYPLTLQAAQRGESALWALGDALRHECGEPGEDHSNNASFGKIREAQAELLAHGIEREFESLRKYRDFSSRFPHGSRLPCVAYSVHVECGTPEMLGAVIALAGREDISKLEARELKQQVEQQRDAANDADDAAKRAAARQEVEAAKEELIAAEEEDRAADTLPEKRAAKKKRNKAVQKLADAERKVAKNPPMPAGNPNAPLRRPDGIARGVYSDQLLNKALQGQIAAAEHLAMAGQDALLALSKDDIGAQIEAALMAADQWRAAAQKLRERTGLKDAHLTVVGG